MFTRGGPRCYETRFALTQRPLVSIVIPTRDKRALLQTTLESIWARTDYDRFEIIIVDNESSDPDAVKYLASLGSKAHVHQWTKPFNYSALNNFGVRREYVGQGFTALYENLKETQTARVRFRVRF